MKLVLSQDLETDWLRSHSATRLTGKENCDSNCTGQKGPGGVKKKHDDLNTTRARYHSLCILESLGGRSPEVRAERPFLEISGQHSSCPFPLSHRGVGIGIRDAFWLRPGLSGQRDGMKPVKRSYHSAFSHFYK
jgi:hypothetical protein